MLIRQAVPGDAAELVRLRAVLLRTSPRTDWNDDWREPALASLTSRLADPGGDLGAFVADRPDGTGLASCAVGVIEHRLGDPHNPSGRFGYVFNVATDPDMRRQGLSRACVTALIAWFRDRGIGGVDLMASPDGESLYLSLGFARKKDPAMRLRLP
ncbi:GNAT family N-acetyltransferase [Actinoplanes sp. NPDC051851]|uniref:GNAT family N-acetyltransferase n=1 Tax=Actinoplanes sp. NPDC051851 TaxID=3154753 RepID=UPI00341B3BF4